jgi:hypothetical protein
LRWLLPVVVLLAGTVLACAQAPAMGYLIVGRSATSAVPYHPQPGDIVLFNEYNRLYQVAFRLAHTCPPTHTGMVIHREDGAPVLLDLTGPTVVGAHVSVIAIPPRLAGFHGTIMVRRLRRPLTAAQSAALTHFARAQEGKVFAVERLALQATPFRPRIGLRRYCFGRTYLDRRRWLCSELVVAAACTAEVLATDQYPANAIYPADLAYDEWVDLSARYDAPLPWVRDPSIIEQPAPGAAIRIPVEH